MQFAPLIPANSPLANLLHRSRYWQQLDAAAKSKNFHLSERALNSFEQTAEKVAHHPKLAAALQNLVKNNRNTNNN